jgi:cytoskeleton protein RodZ
MAEKSERLMSGTNKSGFGEHLKRERELRGVSREEVCIATRIGARYLEALENDEWGALPGGIFNRGFIRAVGRFLGLDEDDLLAQYDLAMKPGNSELEPYLRPPILQQPARVRKRSFLPLGILCLIVLLGISWLGWRWHYKTLRQAISDRAPQVTRLPEKTSTGASASHAPDITSTALPASPIPSETGAQGLELKIEAGKETSVTVSADGSKVFEGSMIAGQSRTFLAQNAIYISAKDAGALLLELNGQTLAPLGPPGQPADLTLTRSNLKSTGGGAD